MNENTFSCTNAQVNSSIKISVMEKDIELTFADTEDERLFDRLRQTLFQTYIQSLVHPH